MSNFVTAALLVSRLFEGHPWLNLHVTAVITVSSVGFSDLRHDLEGIYQNKIEIEVSILIEHVMVPPNNSLFMLCYKEQLFVLF